METVETTLEQASQILNQLYGLPAGLLIVALCIAVGYVLKLIPRFPNGAIPLVVILVAPVLLPVIADYQNDVPWRVWFVRNIVVGLIIGVVAWTIHNQVLSKLEEKLGLFGGGRTTTEEPKVNQ